jgi:hypothetical protein
MSGTTLVEVGTGVETKRYTLHTELLKHHSGYYRGALSGASKETDDSIVCINKLDSEAFGVFVDWIYQGTIALKVSKRGSDLKYRCLVADRRACYPTCAHIIFAFKNLSQDDPLLRLFVDMWCLDNNVIKLRQPDSGMIPDLPKDFRAVDDEDTPFRPRFALLEADVKAPRLCRCRER